MTWMEFGSRRVLQYMVSTECPLCHGKRLRPESLSVTFAGLDIADISGLPLARLSDIFGPYADGTASRMAKIEAEHPEKAVARPAHRTGSRRPAQCRARSRARLSRHRSQHPDALARRAPTAASRHAGALEPVRVVYVPDEPTTGLHPADVERLISQLDGLVEAGNTVIVVEHDMRVAARSDWVMDLGPGAGDEGGRVVASGPPVEVARSIGQPDGALFGVRTRLIHFSSKWRRSCLPVRTGAGRIGRC